MGARFFKGLAVFTVVLLFFSRGSHGADGRLSSYGPFLNTTRSPYTPFSTDQKYPTLIVSDLSPPPKKSLECVFKGSALCLFLLSFPCSLQRRQAGVLRSRVASADGQVDRLSRELREAHDKLEVLLMARRPHRLLSCVLYNSMVC